MKLKYKYLIVGKSGSGKSTIVDKFCTKYKTTQVLSYTTRKPRESELQSPTHIHSDIDTYRMQNDIIAHTERDGIHYWTTRQQLLENDFFVVDWYGVLMLKKIAPEVPCVVIYIDIANSKTLQERMVIRGDNIDIINKRLVLDNIHLPPIDKLIDIKILNDLPIDTMVEVLYNCICSKEKGG